jgi:hypothetical protein
MPGSCHKHATNMLHTCYIHATNMVPVVTVPIYLFISFQSLKAKSKGGRLEYPGGSRRFSSSCRYDTEYFFVRKWEVGWMGLGSCVGSRLDSTRMWLRTL